ncbi:PP2C family protein-serine/threonine phosphatase [Streptomyces sp. NPDC058629]|uniref:PP2C family protein-serine/threonine phosphatase n=1 Tax=Streptomyces sp. NPDC058629 TaxID=3346565 RepID=UPI003669FEF3
MRRVPGPYSAGERCGSAGPSGSGSGDRAGCPDRPGDPDRRDLRASAEGCRARRRRTPTATVLEPSQEAPPLGMAALGTWSFPVDTFSFPHGSTLLCHTDGVTEARDEAGAFYDAAVRLPRLLRHRSLTGDPPAPAQILQLLIEDVGRHTGGRVRDDQALLALHRPAPQAAAVLRRPRV